MNKKLLCLATCAALTALSQQASAAQNPDALARLEAKWLGVMTKIRGWNDAALQQFRDGYKDYPAAVLEKALAAETFEAMQATLDAHAGLRAQNAMEKAMKVYSMGATRPEDADNPQIAEAKALVGKALGDDARDLVFIPITPCTVWDTRFATDPNSAGMINNAVTKRFFSHLDGAGGSFATWGGNPTCPETAQNFIGVRPFAAMMTVYINDASAQGWLTLYRDGDPDPSFATISVYYSPGPTRTQTVISKSSRGYGTGTYDIAAVSRFGNVNASASITGYFVKVNETGTVSSVGTGPGLTGGPITTSGTIDLAATNLLPTTACGATQIPRWNGSAWECANGNSGTVTSVATGPGLAGGPITATGQVDLAATNLLPTTACAPTQIPRWSGTAWACSNDIDTDTNSGGTVTAVTAAAPLSSTGGNTPQISFSNTVVGTVLAGAGGAPAFTGSPELSGTLSLAAISTPTAGNILKNANRFIHNAGFQATFLGVDAGNFTQSGDGTTGVGFEALTSNTTGDANTAMGNQALMTNTTGNGNTAVGYTALRINSAGNENTAVGSGALTNVDGDQNTAVGSGALAALTTGGNNVAMGYLALNGNTTGLRNVGIGQQALLFNSAGSDNIALGNFAGRNSTGSENIYIGNLGDLADNFTMRIGNPLTFRSFVAGIRGVSTGIADAVPVVIDSAGQLGTVSSSAAVKDNIADMGAASEALMQLRPVTFDYRTQQAGSRLQYGLIAEEVDKVYPGLVAKRADGTAETVMYQFLPPMLLNEHQKLRREVEDLRAVVARLEALLQREKSTP